MNNIIFISGFLILLTLYGCATSEPVGVRYDPATDKSSFQTNRIIMGYRSLSGGLTSDQRVMWQALASCSGRNCTPDEIAIAFFNDTSKDLNLDYRRLQMIVDGVTHDWQDLNRLADSGHNSVPPGEFVRVHLATSAFAKLAKAQKVEILFGETGTSVFTVSLKRRAEFQEFVEALGLTE